MQFLLARRAKTTLALYTLALTGLGVRCLVPNTCDIGWLGREIGGWAMYGSEVSALVIKARTSNGQTLQADGFWHAKLVSSATSRLPQSLVDRYAAWLHQRNGIEAEEQVLVEITYRLDRGPKKRIKGSYP